MVYDIVRDVSGMGLVVGLSTQFAGYVSGDPAVADVGRLTALVSGLSYLALLEPQRPMRAFDDTGIATDADTRYGVSEHEGRSGLLEDRLKLVRRGSTR